MNEREIFEKAIEILDIHQRNAFLNEACGEDGALRQRLDQLLASHDQASGFLRTPVMELFPSAEMNGTHVTIEMLATKRDGSADVAADDDEDAPGPANLSFLQPSAKPGSIGRLGHYEILQVLGQGAFGIVFKAFDEKLHRFVAIKAMSPELAATSPPRKRFLREARSVAAIKHENIVQIYSVEEQPLPYLAMEFVDGITLQQKLETAGPLEMLEILHLARQMAAGLAAAHDKGLIHRDIKPGNILLEAGAEQKVKITDFGLARAADDATMTRTGTIAGTPMYMAPEQAMGQTLDHRADLFSLGSVLYQMTCGRPPFRGANAIAVLKRVVDEQPRPILDILPEAPDWLCAIIAKLHAKNPEERYQTAKELVEVLVRCQNELQVNGKVTCVDLTGIAASPPASVSRGTTPRPAHDGPAHDGPAGAPRKFAMLAGVVAISLLVVAGTLWNPFRSQPAGDETSPPPAPLTANPKGPDAAAPAAANGSPTSSKEQSTTTRVTLDLTPPAPLGTWEMGPEPPWFGEGFHWGSYPLRDANTLPGILDRPAVLPGIKRWNVDTVWPRGDVVKVAYSPDGKWIGMLDAHLHLYDAKSLELQRLLPGLRPQYGGHDFAWAPDSQRVAVAADMGTKVRVFDIDGRLQQEITVRGGASSVAWNGAGDRLAVGIERAAENGSCTEIYDRDANLVQSLPIDDSLEMGIHRQGLAWSDDGQRLVACHLDGQVRAWKLDSSQSEVIDNLGQLNHGNAPRMSWHPSGWLAITNRTDVRIYSQDLKLDQSFPMSVGDVRWHPDGRRLLCAGYWLKVWDRVEKKEVLSGEGRFLAVNPSADWSPDGNEFAYSSEGFRSLSVAPASFEQPRWESPPAVRQRVTALAWSPDGQTLAQGTYLSIRFWSSEGRVVRTVPKTAGNYLDWCSDGRELFSGGSSRAVAIPLLGELRILHESDKFQNEGSIACSPDGGTIIISRNDGYLQIVDRQGQTIKEVATGGSSIPYVAWCHATDAIAIAEPGQPLKFLDRKNGWTVQLVGDSPLPNYFEAWAAPRWSPDGELLCVAAASRRGRLWFDAAGKEIRLDGFGNAWRPDSQRYLSSVPDRMDVEVRSRDGSLVMHRNSLGMNFGGQSSWHPRGHVVAVANLESRFTVWRESDFQPHWHGILLPEDKSATFSAAGELLDGKPEEIDRYFVYYLDRGDGRIETLRPADFRKLVADSAGK